MQKGDFVVIDYVARIKDGRVFDVTKEEIAKEEGIYNKNVVFEPKTVVVGAEQVIRGLDKALLEMKVSEERDIEISPEDAFGRRNGALIVKIPLREFRKHGIFPKIGIKIEVNERWAIVRNVSSGRVTLDFNHPLAGKTLEYKVKILEKLEKSEKKLRNLLRFMGLREAEVEVSDEKFKVKFKNVKRGTEKNLEKMVRERIEEFIPEIEEIEFEF
ncbi:MAG: peptidylprolyl isomerase [Candidatus Methanofastidiosia archaeon]